MIDTVGIFGVGLIGMALSDRLIVRGYQVAGNDPAPDRMRALTQAGGQAMSASEIWSIADPILVAVFDTDQLAELIDHAPDGTGARLVVISTCDPDRIADLGSAAKEKTWN